MGVERLVDHLRGAAANGRDGPAKDGRQGNQGLPVVKARFRAAQVDAESDEVRSGLAGGHTGRVSFTGS
ncbi:hypothetical protein D3C87_1106550 [compost metagenome]